MAQKRYLRCSKRRCLTAVVLTIICLSLLQLMVLYPLTPQELNTGINRIQGFEPALHPATTADNQALRERNKTNPASSSVIATSVTTATTASTPVMVVDMRKMSELIDSSLIKDQGIKLKWIALRMKRMMKKWEEGRDGLVKKLPELFTHPKKILLFPGLLTEYSSYNFGEMAFKGGFLGELVQWSDFITTLYMLGHSITIATSKNQLERAESPNKVSPKYDLLFTDYLGLNGIHDASLFGLYKCRIRLLDSFGTEPLYNFRTTTFETDKDSRSFSSWNFEDMRQFWTLFPHTPDNSFLGFVVETPSSLLPSHLKNRSAVIYGKEASYLKGHYNFLEYIKPFVEIHGTLNTKNYRGRLPDYIINHQVMEPAALINLLQSSKLFIGLGFPYEGPGPMEALANGCVFIQPKFSEPHSRFNKKFFHGKPTSRGYRSQMPYLEDFVGEPYVYTVDENSRHQVEEVVQKALQSATFSSFVPYEFTHQGMMERVGTYIQYQNFCDGANLAHGMRASASSRESHANGVIDGVYTSSTCYQSETGGPHWWMVDLATVVAIGKIRITVHFDWNSVPESGSFFAPFQTSLIDSQGETVTTKLFFDDRIFYVWEEINVRARYVRIDTISSSDTSWMQLCAVEVYSEPNPPLWPSLDLLHTVISSPGQSCGDACQERKLMCEPAFFRKLNSVPMLTKHMSCKKVYRLGKEYVDFLPAMSSANNVSIGTTLTVNKEDCVTNENLLLLGCPGRHSDFRRICSCREYAKGQIALPLTE